ncbi:sortase domain-containing protein [Lacticaseibacillus jixiensis]|uniref:sortase domain-containing protein n=1 Tax=Lacticaseibacillus jixiensis TaxID=3231926 RepID=UPI0036F37F3D
MKITNKLVGLAAVILVAAGLGVVTVTAQADTNTTADAATTVSTTSEASRVTLSDTKKAAAKKVTPAAKAAAKVASFKRSYHETYVGTISGLGHSTDVVQGSMRRTTAPKQAGLAMTWGGATRLSTTDKLTTEIAGHATSRNFSWIMGLRVGSKVSVTDASGRSRTYKVYATDNVNDQSYSTKTGKDRYNAIVSAHQGEAVVLQTCISNTVNRLVWAH